MELMRANSRDGICRPAEGKHRIRGRVWKRHRGSACDKIGERGSSRAGARRVARRGEEEGKSRKAGSSPEKKLLGKNEEVGEFARAGSGWGRSSEEGDGEGGFGGGRKATAVATATSSWLGQGVAAAVVGLLSQPSVSSHSRRRKLLYFLK